MYPNEILVIEVEQVSIVSTPSRLSDLPIQLFMIQLLKCLFMPPLIGNLLFLFSQLEWLGSKKPKAKPSFAQVSMFVQIFHAFWRKNVRCCKNISDSRLIDTRSRYAWAYTKYFLQFKYAERLSKVCSRQVSQLQFSSQCKPITKGQRVFSMQQIVLVRYLPNILLHA